MIGLDSFLSMRDLDKGNSKYISLAIFGRAAAEDFLGFGIVGYKGFEEKSDVVKVGMTCKGNTALN